MIDAPRPRLSFVGGRTAGLLSVVGVLLMVAAIAYSFTVRNTVREEIAAKRKEIDSRAAETRELDGQVETLRKEIDEIRKAPLASLINPRALAVWGGGQSCGKGPCYSYIIWLELPYSRKADIKEVRYRFDDPSFLKKQRTSREPSNGFAVGYLGWGVMSNVPITVVPTQGDPFTLDFPMSREVTRVEPERP